MSRHLKEARQAADEEAKNRFAIYFGIAVVAIMVLVVLAVGFLT